MNLVRSLRSKGHEVRILCANEKKKGEEGYYIVPTKSFGPFNGYVKKNDVVLAKPDKKVITDAIRDVDIVHIMTPFTLVKMQQNLPKN
jgi:hypothetical protein